MSYLDCRSATFRELAAGRYFTTFDNVAQSYIQLQSNVSLLSDFSISVDTYIPDVSAISTASMIFGNSVGTNNAMWVTSAGNVVMRDSSGLTVTSLPAITSKSFHRIVYVKTAGNITGFVDGVEVEPSVAFGDFTFNQIGVRQDTSFNFDGIIANVKIVSGVISALDMSINHYYTPTSNTVLDESGNGNNGTFVNVAQGDSVLYRTKSDGNFRSPDGTILEVAY